MRSFYWLSLPFRNLSQCFCFFTIFRVLTNQTVFISQTNRLADLSEQNILLRLTKLDFWCTSAIVFLLSNFQPSSETDHFHLTRLPDHTLFFQLISRLTDETIIYVIRPTDQTILLLSDHQTRQCSYYMYQTTRTDNSPVIRLPNKTIFLSTFYHTGAFSSERQSTSLDHLFWPTTWPDHLPSQLNRSATDLHRTPIHPPDLHPGQDISSWEGSYGGVDIHI